MRDKDFSNWTIVEPAGKDPEMKTAFKKEFVVKWDRSDVILVDPMSFQAKQFFHQNIHRGNDTTNTLYHPVGIKFNELTPFFGHKTKITIEIVE